MPFLINLWVLYLFCITASSSAHCEQTPRILQARQGEIRSSAHHSSFNRSLNCSWLIPASVGEPVILSFSQFFAQCGRDWVAVTTATGAPLSLCGAELPRPMELRGGNVTVTHHFLPRAAPLSAFRVGYARASRPCGLGEFECPSGRCLPRSWRCNGQVECLVERADEQGCRHPKNGTSQGPGVAITTDGEPDGRDTSGVRSSRKSAPATNAPPYGPCGGLLQNFYGTFTPPGLSGPGMECVWTVDPQDARTLRLDLQQLELGPGDAIEITDRPEGTGDTIKTIKCASNYNAIQVESRTGQLSLTYRTQPGSEGRGFNATYRVAGYCLPWEGVCGGASVHCYTPEQRCDGHWDCPETGRDEQGCGSCPHDLFPCGGPGQRMLEAGHPMGRPVCYSAKERCNYQLFCTDGSDERECTICRPGTFHCDSDRCMFESWRCDGQVDCKDGTDELNCTVSLPRKVITAATVGSLVCGLLLVIAMGCTCKLYSLRSREYSMFARISRQEAELIQQQAPPSYGQLIAQGIIPPVEDFPTENPNESSSLTLRGILQLLRQEPGASSHRRRRPRFVRRAVRRMRRWGFLPRTTSRLSPPAGDVPQQAATSPDASEAVQSVPGVSAYSGEGVSQPFPQKLGSLPPTGQAPPPAPPLSPGLPQAVASLTSRSPAVAMPPSGPSFVSLFHSLGLSFSLFRPSSSSSSSTSLPLSTSPCFSLSSEDDVLLIPLSEDATSEDDVPLLT